MNALVDDKCALEIVDLYGMPQSVNIYIQHTLSRLDYCDGVVDNVDEGHDNIVDEVEELLNKLNDDIVDKLNRGFIVKCSRCKKAGHNQLTCKVTPTTQVTRELRTMLLNNLKAMQLNNLKVMQLSNLRAMLLNNHRVMQLKEVGLLLSNLI
ncbi:unnamed protein product [Lathyrus oleraceus]